MSTKRRLLPLVALLGVTLVPIPLAWGAEPVVPRFRVAAEEALAPGLSHRVLVQPLPEQVVHVARIAPDAPLALRSVTSNDSISGEPALERTSSMCSRIDCFVAVNADFADIRSREPVGGVATLGWLMRSPKADHAQLVVGPGKELGIGPLGWSGRILSTDFEQLTLDGLNSERGPHGLVLYTPVYGASTETGRDGVEIVVAPREPLGSLRIGQTEILRLTELREAGDTPIPPGGAVLSAHGAKADALRALWARIRSGRASREVLVRVETDRPVAETVGGSPVLVRDGAPAFPDAPTAFVRGRHPRTIVGRTRSGETLLVTVDGRQPGHSRGMSLAEAADLMIDLGAVEAMNLDGGGSTTFVVGGSVANRPSDRFVRRDGRQEIVHAPQADAEVVTNVERPVANALAVVPASSGQVRPAPPPPEGELDLPAPLRLPPRIADDPASNPGAETAGLIGTYDPEGEPVALAARPGEPYAYVDPERGRTNVRAVLPAAGALVAGLFALTRLLPRWTSRRRGRLRPEA